MDLVRKDIPTSVLKESKYICDSCDNDGVAKFLEKYFKLEV